MGSNKYQRRTAMHAAAQSNSPGIIRMLAERRADINVQDENGFTHLKHSIIQHCNYAVKSLVENEDKR